MNAHPRAGIGERGVDRFDHADHVEADLAAGDGRNAQADSRAEVLEFEIKRLGRREMRGHDVTRAVAEVVFAEALRLREVDT